MVKFSFFSKFITNLKNAIGNDIQEIVTKFIAVNAGDKFDNHGTHCAKPLAPDTNIFNILPNEPTIINGTNIVNASLIEPRYLFVSTFELIDNKTFVIYLQFFFLSL